MQSQRHTQSALHAPKLIIKPWIVQQFAINVSTSCKAILNDRVLFEICDIFQKQIDYKETEQKDRGSRPQIFVMRKFSFSPRNSFENDTMRVEIFARKFQREAV